MPRRRFTLLAALLILGLSGTAGCVVDDEYTTCSNFDDFLYECYFNCAPTFACEDNYGLLDSVIQQLLLECSEGLRQQSRDENSDVFCDDFFVEGWSCEALMVDHLQGQCDW